MSDVQGTEERLLSEKAREANTEAAKRLRVVDSRLLQSVGGVQATANRGEGV